MSRLLPAIRQITTGKNDKGLKLYDPGYLNTAPVRSSICYIDGDEGILRYRGYPIEELAESSSFMEVAYLLSECSFCNFLLLNIIFFKPNLKDPPASMYCLFICDPLMSTMNFLSRDFDRVISVEN